MHVATRAELPELTFVALLRVLTYDLICEALAECGRETKRTRKLPSEFMVLVEVAMAIYRRLSMGDVVERVAGAVTAPLFGWGPAEAPHSTSITKARDRVGWEVMRKIFQLLAIRLVGQFATTRKWHDLVVRALDGSTARAPDTAANDRWFGRPTRKGKAKSAFPQLRLVVVFDVFTRIATDAVLGPYGGWSEVRVAEYLLDRIEQGTLLLLDRAYHSFVWPARLETKGVKFVVRAKLGANVAKTKPGPRLGSGDRLCSLLASRPALKRFPDLPPEVLVREITVRRRGFRPIVLLTNLLEAEKYTAKEIAELYQLRWEAEHGYREIKAQLAGEHVTFRSHRPDRVLQEAYGLLIAYNCARALMCEAADERGISPLALSFTKSVECIRRALEQSCECSCAFDLVLAISHCELQPKRVGRRCPREVKPRAIKYAVKRRGLPSTGRFGWRERQRAEAAAAQALAG